jgi:hypothetical protein
LIFIFLQLENNHQFFESGINSIRIKISGALRLIKEQLSKLKKGIQKFQIDLYPEIQKSIVQHGANRTGLIKEKEYQFKQRHQKDTDREILIGLLKTCYKKANSKQSFIDLIKQCNLIYYERGKKSSGLIYHGAKYRFGKS